MLRLQRDSLEYVRVPIAATEAGTTVNPTGDAVALAAPAAGQPPVTYVAGSWETATINGVTTYYARALFGTGGLDLAVGFYDLYVKITDSPEIPVILAGGLEIF